jgi:processive 1,2-diacylglycerol beta-glucosyltransferase
MAELYLKSDNTHLGHISEAELNFLLAQLEEEDSEDVDYAIDRLTLEYLKANGLSAHLAQLLEQALGEKDEVEIRYTAG